MTPSNSTSGPPKHLKDFVESQIYAQYPSVQIKENPEDYSEPRRRPYIYGTELGLTKDTVMPIKTFASFEVDPLAGITGVLAKMEQAGEECWIQILARPIDDAWQEQGQKLRRHHQRRGQEKDRGSRAAELLQIPIYILSNLVQALFVPPDGCRQRGGAEKKSSGRPASRLKAVEEKSTKLGYQVKSALPTSDPTSPPPASACLAIVGGFKQFNTTNLNGFTNTKMYNSREFLEDYQARLFFDQAHPKHRRARLAIPLAAQTSGDSQYGLDHRQDLRTTVQTRPRASLSPTKSASSALSKFRGRHLKFGIKRKDRGRHMYISGKPEPVSHSCSNYSHCRIFTTTGFCHRRPARRLRTDTMKYIPEHRLEGRHLLQPG